MHPVPSGEIYRLVREDGTSFGPYPSLCALVRRLSRFALARIGTHFRTVRFWQDPRTGEIRRRPEDCPDYVILDALNTPVDPTLLRAAWEAEEIWQRRQSRRAASSVFRFDPVPRTGKVAFWSRYRYPRVMADRRAAIAADADCLPIRRRRAASNLPEAGYGLFRHVEHSWKRHRRTQWIPKP